MISLWISAKERKKKMELILACLAGYAAGAVTVSMCKSRKPEEGKKRPESLLLETDQPSQEEIPGRMRRQFENFLNYNGTERGQRSIEDE